MGPRGALERRGGRSRHRIRGERLLAAGPGLRVARRQLLALLLTGRALAQDQSRARRVILEASRALDADSPARFLARFDKKRFPDYRIFRRQIVALLEQKRVGSSVEIPPFDGSGDEIELTVDWLLQLSPKTSVGPIERRREAVRVRVRVASAEARIIALEPLSLFFVRRVSDAQ